MTSFNTREGDGTARGFEIIADCIGLSDSGAIVPGVDLSGAYSSIFAWLPIGHGASCGRVLAPRFDARRWRHEVSCQARSFGAASSPQRTQKGSWESTVLCQFFAHIRYLAVMKRITR
jgi:hypothetical protein